jgi:hypothetical protein
MHACRPITIEGIYKIENPKAEGAFADKLQQSPANHVEVS